ncbi:MAG TPA: right-handed parallel beta-helix repeat-containing protein, partial [bacterium]|nr:right-handed parallel beta-helix repeat-containing protein [bacterium]
YFDNTLPGDDTYYFRVTAYDNHAGWPNESYYSDSMGVFVPYAGPIWYVSSDMGNDGTGIGSPSKPFRTIFRALQAILPGDTVQLFACSAVWTESVALTQDSIAVVGMGSTRSIIEPGAAIGCTAAARSALILRDLCIRNAGGGNSNVQWSGVARSEISGCSIAGSTGRGIQLSNVATSVFSGNHIAKNAGYGIDCVGDNNYFFNNQLKANTNTQLYFNGTMQDNRIDSNLVQGGGGTAIYLTCDSNSVTNNRILSPVTGIHLNNADSTVITGNHVSGATGSNNLAINNGYGNVIDSNTFTGGAVAQVKLYTNSHRNRFRYNTVTGGLAQGLLLENTTDNLFEQNYFAGNADTAVWITGTSAADTFTKNNISSANGRLVTGSATAGAIFDLTRNWWGMTDSNAVAAGMTGSAADKLRWQPFRLGECDTIAGADTIAPAAPAAVTVTIAGDN